MLFRSGRDSLDRRFYERHYTKVDPKHFEPIVEGMWRGVNVGGTSMLARLEGLDVCGKTGTAENPRGRDHSTFLSFAPKDNPKIAISVYVENGGFGASAALPIASLLEEYYLTDTIRRPALLDYVRNNNDLIVTGDVKAGEQVVSAGASYLVDGQQVKILTE